jgi:hypothetical protein
MIRNELEMNENKRLIEKQQKLDSIIETLKSQEAEETEIEEIKAMMSAAEITQIKQIQDVCNKLVCFQIRNFQNIYRLYNLSLNRIDISEIQLEDTAFIFEYYFNFNIPFNLPVKKQ